MEGNFADDDESRARNNGRDSAGEICYNKGCGWAAALSWRCVDRTECIWMK
ncbi:MAG: hypothetical protein LBL26_09750 [Peptococcaceae bacterium]|nr:hypothetical protein [Peptococcaceae bacterium]